jgi:hypothetical protein
MLYFVYNSRKTNFLFGFKTPYVYDASSSDIIIVLRIDVCHLLINLIRKIRPVSQLNTDIGFNTFQKGEILDATSPSGAFRE